MLLDIRKRVKKSIGFPYYSLSRGGILPFQNHKVICSDLQIKESVQVDAHMTPYFVHQSNTKMYLDLKKAFGRKG